MHGDDTGDAMWTHSWVRAYCPHVPQQVGVGHKPVAEACVMGVAMAVVRFKMERWVPGVTSSLAS